MYGAALFESAEEHFLGECILDLCLNEPCKWTRTVANVVALIREPVARFIGEHHLYLLPYQLTPQFFDELVHDLLHNNCVEWVKGYNRVESVPEFRVEELRDRISAFSLAVPASVAEADRALIHVLRARI